MRNRSIKKQVWLNSKENELLKNKCRKAGISVLNPKCWTV